MQECYSSIERDICILDYKIFMEDPDKQVMSGPFEGMRLCPESRWPDGNLCLKLFGYYEHELHPAIEKAISRRPNSVINVGCGEGYYAVGMAMRLPKAKIYAIDISSEAVRLCRQAATLNNVVDRVGVGLVDGDGFSVSSPCLLIIDNEGSEEKVVECLDEPKGYDLIIECHDFMNAGTADRITKRLSATHEVERIDVDITLPIDFLSWQSVLAQAIILTEKRALPCCWLACWSKG